MLALTAPLKLRLQSLPALAGWAINTGTELVDRSTLLSVDVRCTGAGVANSQDAIVSVAPQWTVTLAAPIDDNAAERLDAAFAAVVSSLHGWLPGLHGGTSWAALRLQGVREPIFSSAGLAGTELVFTTSARYTGCACS